LVLVACVIAGLLALITTALPDAAARNAPLREFSAGRAAETLAELLGEGVPHPVGSAANGAVLERLLVKLRELDLDPELQESFTCDDLGPARRSAT